MSSASPIPARPTGSPLGIPRTIPVEQRQFAVSDNPDEVLSAILGSCVSICLHDPVHGIGGMTHTVFPEAQAAGEALMLNEFELLYNAMMKLGSRRSDLVASVVGGAHLIQSTRQAGTDLSRVTLQVLKAEGVELNQSDLGGSMARRVKFFPTTGALIIRYVGEAPREEKPVRTSRDDGVIDLF